MVEHTLHTGGVASSILAAPTILNMKSLCGHPRTSAGTLARSVFEQSPTRSTCIFVANQWVAAFLRLADKLVSQSKESMSADQPILLAKVIELVKSRNLDEPDSLFADFSAAELIKTYALMREIRPARGPAQMVRDAQIPPEDWERIVSFNKVDVALSGTTVRLEGSPLQGGTPSVWITDISFSETSLLTILDRYCANSPGRVPKKPKTCQAATKSESDTPSARRSLSLPR